MIKKQRLIICVLVIVVLAAMLSALVACDVVLYEPDKAEKPPVSDAAVPMPLEYKLYVQGNSGRLTGTPIGSTVPEYYVFTEGATISSALLYIKEGYELAGWYTDAELNNALTSYIMPNRDLHVYAKWTEIIPDIPPVIEPNTVKINFEIKTLSDIGTVAELQPLTGKAGEKVKSQAIVGLPNPTCAGFNFLGWYTDRSLTIPYVLTDDTVFSDGDITLYAKWDKQFYIVTYNTNGGSSVSSVKLTTGSQVIKPETPIKAGYNFDGWYMEVDVDGVLTETAVDFSTLFIEDKNIEIYAKWTAGTFKVTFDESTSNGVYEPVSAKVGEDITLLLPTPTRVGYKFIGWYENKTITGSSKPFDSTAMPPYNLTLYAHWSIQDHELAVTISSGDMIGELYPEGDAGHEPVYVMLKAQASAKTEHTDFKSLSFVLGISEMDIKLLDGTVKTLSNASDINKLLRISYETNTLEKDTLTDIKVNFTLDKNAPIEYAGATFELKIKFYTSSIVDANGDDVNADEIKPSVEIA